MIVPYYEPISLAFKAVIIVLLAVRVWQERAAAIRTTNERKPRT